MRIRIFSLTAIGMFASLIRWRAKTYIVPCVSFDHNIKPALLGSQTIPDSGTTPPQREESQDFLTLFQILSPGLKSDILRGNFPVLRPATSRIIACLRCNPNSVLRYNTITERKLQAFFHNFALFFCIFYLYALCCIKIRLKAQYIERKISDDRRRNLQICAAAAVRTVGAAALMR